MPLVGPGKVREITVLPNDTLLYRVIDDGAFVAQTVAQRFRTIDIPLRYMLRFLDSPICPLVITPTVAVVGNDLISALRRLLLYFPAARGGHLCSIMKSSTGQHTPAITPLPPVEVQ